MQKPSKKSKRHAPITINYEIDTPQNLLRAYRELYKDIRALKVDARVAGAATHCLDGLTKVMIPREPMQITQQVTTGQSKEQIIAGFMESLPAELRNAIVAYGRTRLEANLPTSHPAT